MKNVVAVAHDGSVLLDSNTVGFIKLVPVYTSELKIPDFYLIMNTELKVNYTDDPNYGEFKLSLLYDDEDGKRRCVRYIAAEVASENIPDTLSEYKGFRIFKVRR